LYDLSFAGVFITKTTIVLPKSKPYLYVTTNDIGCASGFHVGRVQGCDVFVADI